MGALPLPKWGSIKAGTAEPGESKSGELTSGVATPVAKLCVLRKAISSYCVSFPPSVNWDSNTYLSLTDQANLRRKEES